MKITAPTMRESIKAEDLELLRYREEFIPLLFEAGKGSQGGEFTRWMPWCHAEYSISDAENFIQHCIESWKSGIEYNFAIFDPSRRKFLGGIGLSQPNMVHSFYNLGYWVRTSEQNRGIARRAARVLAQTAFEDIAVNRIEIIAAAENRASRTAAGKAGAKYEGILRRRLVIGDSVHDGAMYSFIKEDFSG